MVSISKASFRYSKVCRCCEKVKPLKEMREIHFSGGNGLGMYVTICKECRKDLLDKLIYEDYQREDVEKMIAEAGEVYDGNS